MSDLKVVSYNCHGLKIGKNCFYDRLEVEKLLTDNDIVCLQETWLSKQQEGDLKCMNNKCNDVANSPNDDACGVIVGRRKEGVAILWNTKFDRYITPQKYDYDWVVSIEISHDHKKMYIFNVYLPCDNRENEVEYLDRLAKLHKLIAECDSSCMTIIGDFNANVNTRANFAVLLEEFCEQFSYVWTSCQRLPSDTYTYVSDAWCSQSWLDHCISTEYGNDIITNAHVVYESIQSDHLPVFLN